MTNGETVGWLLRNAEPAIFAATGHDVIRGGVHTVARCSEDGWLSITKEPTDGFTVSHILDTTSWTGISGGYNDRVERGPRSAFRVFSGLISTVHQSRAGGMCDKWKRRSSTHVVIVTLVTHAHLNRDTCHACAS
ncbi:Transcription factor TCP subgroup [Arabidopsis suecica]|uniref:Transcription factor TCP subgroup n=1 Tax=Arabidopsis suecica TaxID=45249 RepID=A0A8T1ZX69_ARASU|nr:Transcription factor TCP subgroup [Arabidopsis suecica]